MTDQDFQVFNSTITTILKLLTYQTLLLFFFIEILCTFHKDLQQIKFIKLASEYYGKKG
ncbi:25005_t:CDS:1, partial [Gigaspora rosea]